MLLVLFVIVVGPTIFLLDLLPTAFGAYLGDLVRMSVRTPAFGGIDWFANWTVFYWAWWISWTPFVSTFIARISRGRTIREFVAAVLIAPTVVSALWFVVLGGAGINLQVTGQADIVAAGETDEALAFFTALEQYPGFTATGVLAMLLVAVFWVTGADSSALVLGMLSSRGALDPKKWLVALWAAATAAVAAVLLYVGGLDALQTFTVIVATPFIVVMGFLCWALYADLRRDPLRARPGTLVRQHAPSPGAYASWLAGQDRRDRATPTGHGEDERSQPGSDD